MALRQPQAVTADSATQIETLHGWHFSETTGIAGAKIEFRANTAAGAVLFMVTLAANETAADNYPNPLAYPDPIWVEVVTGAVVGMVY